LVAGIAKSYNLTPDYVLHEMSYANIALYSSVLPSFDDETDKTNKKGEPIIKADDPKNRDLVHSILFG